MQFKEYLTTLSCSITELRKDILLILWDTSTPLKAYEILEKLKQVRNNPKPPTVYRVLDFLLKHNIIHRLDNAQSYILCHNQIKHEIGKQIIMLCEKCKITIEISNPIMQTLLTELAKNHHFHINTEVIELTGKCRTCYSQP